MTTKKCHSNATYRVTDVLIIVSYLFMSLTSPSGVHASWWYLGLSSSAYHSTSSGLNHRTQCLQMSNDVLAVHQRSLCIQSNSLLQVVSDGASVAIGECQHQLRHSRWNCSTSNITSVFGNVLSRKSREKAYIYAITSAGIMYSVVKACAKGMMPACSCDLTNSVVDRFTQQHRDDNNNIDNDFLWGGCSHDIAFGDKFTRDFADESEDLLTDIGAMNVWNNGAGRQSVSSTTRLLCKCHGVSGSCSSKICWRAVSSFRDVGDQLKDKFDGASRVRFKKSSLRHRARQRTNSRMTSSSILRQLFRPADRRQKRPTADDMVYIEDSSDFCDHNEAVGSVGTAGRLCNRTSHGTDGCQLMCCGRGYKTLVETSVEDCSCTFVWCCRVDCNKCRKSSHKHYCN